MSHKYLNKLGILSNDPVIFNTEAIEEPKYQKDYDKEKSIHSFDCRETFEMDYTSATWLYEHIQAYKEWAGDIVDLEYHKFYIPVLYDIPNEKLVYYPNNKLKIAYKYMYTDYKHISQKEAIDLIIKYLEYYFTSKNEKWSETYGKIENKGFEYLQGAFRIYAEIITAMWW